MILPGGFDMELYNPELSYNQIQSIVMSEEHPDSDKIQFHVLDWFGKEGGYGDRIRAAHHFAMHNNHCCIPTETEFIFDAEELIMEFLSCETEGEGICFRLDNSPYKQGRSTLKEQYLVKLARFSRTELTIIGFKEQFENGNPDLRNDVGYMKRQTCGDMMVGKNTLGAFLCKDISGNSVDVGTGVGLTDKLRKEIWSNRDCYFGKQITVKHKPHGQKDVLRHPIFVGFREKGY
jgi:hypothetical protein